MRVAHTPTSAFEAPVGNVSSAAAWPRAFRGWQPLLAAAHSWTPVFFLDAVALAAGNRLVGDDGRRVVAERATVHEEVNLSLVRRAVSRVVRSRPGAS